jgi:hypothetical protein
MHRTTGSCCRLFEREAVLAGMLDLVGAVDTPARFVKNEARCLRWCGRCDPFRLDRRRHSGRNNRYSSRHALLVLDVRRRRRVRVPAEQWTRMRSACSWIMAQRQLDTKVILRHSPRQQNPVRHTRMAV